MKFSHKTRYGLRALIDIAAHSEEKQVSILYLSERNGIPKQYLEQVFASLKRAGLVRSIKGSQGGYLLAKDAKEITLASIVLALEGNYKLEDETVQDNIENDGIPEIIQKKVISQINEQMEGLLTGITLDDLAREYKESLVSEVDMYFI